MKNKRKYTSEKELRKCFNEHHYYVKESAKDLAVKLNAPIDLITKLRKELTLVFYPQNARRIYIGSKKPNESIKDKIRVLLKDRRGSLTVDTIADTLDIAPKHVRSCLDTLGQEGHNILETSEGVSFSSIIPTSTDHKLVDIKKNTSDMYEFGAFGDQHYCSNYCREDVCEAMYDQYERQGIKVVFNTGNYIDGQCRLNMNDLLVHGMERQVKYFIEHFPKRKGIVTKFISGNDHEGWWTKNEGTNIGSYTELKAKEAGRDDLIFLGHMEANVIIPAKKGKTTIRVVHPGGGSSYAYSYAPQKLVESYTGGEKPNILLVGHYHKADYNFIRGVHTIQTGTGMSQSPFMRSKKLEAHLGGWTFKFGTDDNGAITRFATEFFPFYNNEYYQQPWQYKF